MEKGLVTYGIKIDGQEIPGEYGVISIEVQQEVNKIPSAFIRIFDGGGRSGDDFVAGNSKKFNPGSKLEIEAGYENNNASIYKGVIVKHGIRMGASVSELYVECKHEAVKLTLGRKNFIFKDQKYSDVISKIINNANLSGKVTSTKDASHNISQNYVSDWDFIQMLADNNGLITTFDKDKIVINEPDPSVSAVHTVTNGDNLIYIKAEMDARTQIKKVDGLSWDSKEQKVAQKSSKGNLKIEQGKLSSSDLTKTFGDVPYSFVSSSALPMNEVEAIADAIHNKSNLSKITGAVKIVGTSDVLPGKTVEIAGLSDNFNGKAYVTGVRHIIENGKWETELKLGLSREKYAEVYPDVHAPSSSAVFPAVKGLYIGKVLSVGKDNDGQHRVEVKLPTFGDNDNIFFARLSNQYVGKTGDDSGMLFFPEKDTEVVLGFINEDPNDAVILGSLYSSKNNPTEEVAEDNFFKKITTQKDMEISFDDDKKIIQINTPSGNTVLIDDDNKQITITDCNDNKVEMTDAGIVLDSPKDIGIKAGGAINMEATKDIILKATGDLKGEGVNVEMKGTAGFKAEGAQAEVSGSAQTTIKGGVVMIN